MALLASTDSAFITGQEHIVDGGLLASGPDSLDECTIPVTHRMAGMAYGSSGQTPTYRRL